MKNKERKSFAVVVPVNPLGKVLLGKRREDGKWTTPAGGVESGETFVDAVIREAKEEAFLDIVPSQLEFLYTKKTPQGYPVACFLFRCAQEYTSPNLDHDKEVPEWLWIHPDDFPEDFLDAKNDVRRPTILDAVAKFNYVEKALSLEAREKLLSFIQRVRLEDVGLAEQLYTDVFPNAKQALESELPQINKSVVQMAHLSDGGDLRTEAAAIEYKNADGHLLDMLTTGMGDYQYGDLPVEFSLDHGQLYLVKVDDGLFSGYFKKVTQLPEGELQDNAKVRIEKQTLATLSHFLVAKGWFKPEIAPHTSPTEKQSQDFSNLEYKIKILELLDRITS